MTKKLIYAASILAGTCVIPSKATTLAFNISYPTLPFVARSLGKEER